MLSRAERRAFRRLAIFAGSFTMGQALRLCAKSNDDRDRAFGAVVGLVRRSMVAEAGEGRYRLLETLRTYALDKLVAAGSYQRVARKHALAFARIARRARKEWATGNLPERTEEMRVDSSRSFRARLGTRRTPPA